MHSCLNSCLNHCEKQECAAAIILLHRRHYFQVISYFLLLYLDFKKILNCYFLIVFKF